jgi:hypothetical protein
MFVGLYRKTVSLFDHLFGGGVSPISAGLTDALLVAAAGADVSRAIKIE